MPESRILHVGELARVEGEGALHLVVEGDRITDLRLEIFEPPRLFEAFLRGRPASELPDLMARICGLCPAAYQMSAVHAIEAAFGVEVHPGTRALRRLYYAGEWIESHLLHMLFLAAPDFLGLDDAFELARSHRAEVERGMKLRGLGNRILSLLGGRPVNPLGVCIGGFVRTPSQGELDALADDLRRARGEAEALLRWFASLPVPARPQDDLELVSLRHPDEYPMNEGRLVSSAGLDVPPADFDAHFEETQVPHSTALHSRLRDRGAYLVGPLARVALNADRLAPVAKEALESLAPRLPAPDPAASVFARGIEVIQAIDDGVRAIESLEAPPGPAAWSPRAGVGHGVTEAPRGILYVRVETDAAGDVADLKIVPPTSQNQARIEADLQALAPEILTLSEDEARRRCEMVIRDYDPCISCATHFLKLSIERVEPGGSGRVSAVVVGVGSPQGDDAVGLAVARALASERSLPTGARVLALARPGLDLLEALRGADFAVIVDALCDGGTPGDVRRLGCEALARAARAPSSHALGVAEALALGEALGALPPRVEIVGIEIGGAGGVAAPLSPAVAAAVAPACRAVRELLAARAAQGPITTGVPTDTRPASQSRSASDRATQP